MGHVPRRFGYHILRMAIFTADERERLRDELVSAAQSDPNLCGAAHTGSAAAARLDRWSDIDLALCLAPGASHEGVVAEWTGRLYRDHGAVAHVDVSRGATLYRVFLLRNTLQVDISFWPRGDFGAFGPNFRLVFGEANPPQPAPQPEAHALIGMAWLYALHLRSSLERGRVLQAEYMLSGMRSQIGELTCLRCGVLAMQGRGLDDLPAVERDAAAASVPRSLEPTELERAFRNAMQVLLKEIRHVDPELEARLSGPLKDMAD